VRALFCVDRHEGALIDMLRTPRTGDSGVRRPSQPLLQCKFAVKSSRLGRKQAKRS
jgi:hypothetical protein